MLTEQIRVSKNRVNVVEQADNETDTDNVTGGWLLEIDNYFDNPNKITIIDGRISLKTDVKAPGKPAAVKPA